MILNDLLLTKHLVTLAMAEVVTRIMPMAEYNTNNLPILFGYIYSLNTILYHCLVLQFFFFFRNAKPTTGFLSWLGSWRMWWVVVEKENKRYFSIVFKVEQEVDCLQLYMLHKPCLTNHAWYCKIWQLGLRYQCSTHDIQPTDVPSLATTLALRGSLDTVPS